MPSNGDEVVVGDAVVVVPARVVVELAIEVVVVGADNVVAVELLAHAPPMRANRPMRTQPRRFMIGTNDRHRSLVRSSPRRKPRPGERASGWVDRSP